jgi:hypothetical protein
MRASSVALVSSVGAAACTEARGLTEYFRFAGVFPRMAAWLALLLIVFTHFVL